MEPAIPNKPVRFQIGLRLMLLVVTLVAVIAGWRVLVRQADEFKQAEDKANNYRDRLRSRIRYLHDDVNDAEALSDPELARQLEAIDAEEAANARSP